MLELPSETTDKLYLQVPLGNVVESDDEWAECGKWMIVNPTKDLTWVDTVWTDLQVLVRNGYLIMMKASTLGSTLDIEKQRREKEMSHGVVMCFTLPGRLAAKRAAEEIRKIIHYEGPMYYKKNKLTKAGIAYRFGHEHVSEYMHTFKGRFYMKSAYFRWIQEEHDEEKENRGLSFKEDLWNLGLEQLPSHCREQYVCLPLKKHVQEGDGFWHLTCRQDDGNRLTEADRVWVVAKKFFDKGLFTKIVYHKEPELIHFNMYVADYSDINALLKTCDDFTKSACFGGFRYFRIVTKLYKKFSYKIKYVYTEEGELYEDKADFRHFIMQK